MVEEKQSESRIYHDKIYISNISNEKEVSTCFFCGRRKYVYNINMVNTAISPEHFGASCCIRCMRVIPRGIII